MAMAALQLAHVRRADAAVPTLPTSVRAVPKREDMAMAALLNPLGPSRTMLTLFRCFSYTCFFTVLFCGILVLLPRRVALKVPKVLRRVRSKCLSWVKRAKELSKDGPFYKLMVWIGRKFGRGFLSSRCRAPEVRASAGGAREVLVTVTPDLPYNPFHEEDYFVAWCREDEAQERWREKMYDPKYDCEKVAGNKFRMYLEGLPEHTLLRVRACAVNVHGRSDWSRERPVETLAVPSSDNGFQGPLGPACPPGAQYTWTQTKTEVFLKIPLRPEWTAKRIRFYNTPSRIEIRVPAPDNGADEVLVGPLCKKVKVDDVFWCVEEDKQLGRHLSAQLLKFEPMDKWPCIIEAKEHPHIDVRMLRFWTDGDALTDLSGLNLQGLS